MKALFLPACFAAVAAVAGELKDPAAVAQEWNATVEKALQPLARNALPRGGDTLGTPPLERSLTLESERSQARPPRASRFPGPLYDAPSRANPRRQPPDVPDNALPWLYRGSKYWLVPLGGPPASR